MSLNCETMDSTMSWADLVEMCERLAEERGVELSVDEQYALCAPKVQCITQKRSKKIKYEPFDGIDIIVRPITEKKVVVKQPPPPPTQIRRADKPICNKVTQGIPCCNKKCTFNPPNHTIFSNKSKKTIIHWPELH